MKSITEILGETQLLLGISYDIQETFEEFLTNEHRSFLAMLRVIEEGQPVIKQERHLRGRPAYDFQPIIRAYFAMSFFRIDSTSDLINRLKSDSSLRKICGFTKVPSAATFSRRLDYLASHHFMEQKLNAIVIENVGDRIIGHLARDSTSIISREKPKNKKKDVKIAPKAKKKRGRPKKGEERPSPEKKRLEKQISQKPGEAIKELNKDCTWGCKKNSQGNVQFWKGYKLHLDVIDFGFPVTAVVTGANVHDSQLAIPMEKMTAKKITHLYSLMDAAYDAAEINNFITACGRVAITDPNKRRSKNREPLDPAEIERFKIRSTVERSNAHLKDWLIPSKIMVRGFRKVNFMLMTSVVLLAAIKTLQLFILPHLS